MKKNACAVSVLVVALFLPMILLSTGGSVYARPEETNFIRADGTVSGTAGIQRNGDVYTFTGNITGSLTVEKDNVVVDGAGFTLQGGNRGIVLSQRQNVTVKNARLTLDGGYIIDVEYARDCTLEGNLLVGTPQPIPELPPGPVLGPIAINFLHSQNITVKNNTITNFFYALSLEWSNGHTIIGNNLVDGILGINIVNTTGCVFRDNCMSNSSFSIRTYPLYQYKNDLDSSNKIDGQPIIYWLNVEGKTVPSDAAYIILINCANITVQNASPKGITLASTANSTITKVNMTGRGDGVTLLDCLGINIIDSVLRDHAIGIDIENSSNNNISGNDISNHLTRGIDLGNAYNNVISGNNLTNNNYAIAPFQDAVSTSNLVVSNNFSDNDFAIIVRGNMQIINNTFVCNNQAILCYSGSNTMTGNTFNSNGQGVILQSTNNILKNNSFINNTNSLPINGDNFVNDADFSNTLNGKPMCYWVNQHNQTVPSDAGFVALVNCSGIVVEGLTLTDHNQGILLAFTTNSTITGNLIANNTNGIYFYGSPNNTFIGNNITGNGYAVYISGATGNFMSGYSAYVPSSGNTFYRNNFVNNNQTLYDIAGAYYISGASPSANIWDNGKEGNYWNDYHGSDVNGDGVGDSFYVVYANNTDSYPFMQPVVVEAPEIPVSPSLSLSPSATTTSSASPSSTPSFSQSPSPTPSLNQERSSSIFEYAAWIILPLLMMAAVFVLAVRKRFSVSKKGGNSN
jgi:parallel beta-helix repeat protein